MQIPIELLEDECIRVGSQRGKKLLGVEEDKPVEDEEIETRLTQAREDEEEFSPEWIEELEQLMKVYDKKKTITKRFDIPSFALDGFDCSEPFGTPVTQMGEGSGGGHNNNHAAEIPHAHFADHPVRDDQPVPEAADINNMQSIIEAASGAALDNAVLVDQPVPEAQPNKAVCVFDLVDLDSCSEVLA